MAVKMCAVLRLGTFLSICSVFNLVQCTRLNVPRVLLPYRQRVASNYTLELVEVAGGGCYQWTSSNPEAVTVTVLDAKPGQACGLRAEVSAISHHPTRSTSIIMADNTATGETFRCDVIVDKINSFELVTTTRELLLEDAPELIEVVARNDQDDTFSGISGVPFEWSISSGSTPSQGVVRFMRSVESTYKTPPSLQFWEDQGLQGHAVLLEGSKTGAAKISVRLAEPDYAHIAPKEVTLVVVANIAISPLSVFLLENAVVQYRVDLIRHGRPTEIELPSQQYYLEVTDPSVAQLSSGDSMVTALALGHTTLLLKDSNIVSHELARRPQAEIYVVKPSYLLFTVHPGDNWALQEQSEYVIEVKIYDERHHRVHLSDNLAVDVTFPADYFKVLMSSENGTHHLVRTKGPGSCQLKASFLGFRTKVGSIKKAGYDIQGTQDVMIYEKLLVTPSVMLFPWDPVLQPSYVVYPKASGGTKFYRWFVSNSTVAHISYQPEELSVTSKVTTKSLGDAEVIAEDAFNSFFISKAKVSVQPVADLEVVPSLLETDYLNDVAVPVALYGYEDLANKSGRRAFDDCSKVPLSVEMVDPAKFTYIEDSQYPPMGHSCRTLQFTCKAVGHTRIYVSYAAGDVTFKSTTVIGCHKTLKPVHPVKSAVIAYGSFKDVAFEGGPRPWPMLPEGHFARMTANNASLVSVMRIIDPFRHNRDLHVFRVLCRDLGETNLELAMGNNASATIPNPAHNTATIRLVCGVPDSVTLRVKCKGPKNAKVPCPATEDGDKVPVPNSRDIEVDVVVKDALGRRFSNITSFDIHWELSNYHLAKPDSHRDVVTHVDGSKGYRKVSRDFQTIHPAGKSGHVTVSARIVGYNHQILRHSSLPNVHPVNPAVSGSVSLSLVGDAKVEPSQTSVFNHPSHTTSVKILEGSGFYELVSSDNSIADVKFDEVASEIKISPLKDGAFVLSVHDLCLDSESPATVRVQVVGVYSIHVTMITMVEHQTEVVAKVHLLDSNQDLLPSSVFALVGLQPVVGSNIIKVRALRFEEDAKEVNFAVHGAALGTTTLQFTTSSTGTAVTSEVLPVQVFAPLKLNPRNITLIVGAMFQVWCTGGPQPQGRVEYTIDSASGAMATVVSNGVVTAMQRGNTVLTARALGYHSESGEAAIYSQDQVTIFVVALRGIKIRAPLRRLLEGTWMSVFAAGHGDFEDPFAFCSAVPALLFQWSVSNPHVVSVESLFQQSGLQVTQENACAVRLRALRPGKTSLRLQVRVLSTASSSKHEQLLRDEAVSAELQIEVVPRLELVRPHACVQPLLMGPNAQLPLKTNRDGDNGLNYEVLGSSKKPVISIDTHGVVTSTGDSGRATVGVALQEDFGMKQTFATLIEVVSIAYAMTETDVAVHALVQPLPYVPVGLEARLKITFHDGMGRKLDAASSRLRWRPSRDDLVLVSRAMDNDTLLVRVGHSGNTVLKLWDEFNPRIVDFIPLFSQSALSPHQSALTVGDVVCFDAALVSAHGDAGVWSSMGKSIDIDPRRGIAVATQPGRDVVSYNISTHLFASQQLVINPITSLSIKAEGMTHVSTLVENRIPVRLGTEESNLYGRSCRDVGSVVVTPPFECIMSFVPPLPDAQIQDVFVARPGFDFEKGTYYCALSPAGRLGSLHMAALQGGGVSLGVSSPQVTPPAAVVLPLVAGFHLHLRDVVLSNARPFATVGVTATAAMRNCLKTYASEPDLVEVVGPQADPKWEHTYTFSLRVRDFQAFWKHDFHAALVNVTFECPATRQSDVVTVRITLEAPPDGTISSCPAEFGTGWHGALQSVWSHYQFWIMTFFLASATAFVMLGYKPLLGKRTAISSRPDVFATSPQQGHTPPGTLPWHPPGSADRSGSSPTHLWSVPGHWSPQSRESPRSASYLGR